MHVILLLAIKILFTGNQESSKKLALLEIPKEGYNCVAHHSFCLVYLPTNKMMEVVVEGISNLDARSEMPTNEIFVTPIVHLTPSRATFTSQKPAIIEVKKILQLDNNSAKVIQYFSSYYPLKHPQWKEMESCTVLNDRIVFKTCHFGLFAATARFSFPSVSLMVTAQADKDNHGQINVIKIDELPGLKVKIPSSSICLDTEIKATVYYDNPVMCKDKDSLATACLTLEPHGVDYTLSRKKTKMF